MKAGQDALERRLWAKQERLKAEHEKQIQVEKDMSVNSPGAPHIHPLMVLQLQYRPETHSTRHESREYIHTMLNDSLMLIPAI